jgi:hypothetical protein
MYTEVLSNINIHILAVSASPSTGATAEQATKWDIYSKARKISVAIRALSRVAAFVHSIILSLNIN